MSFVTDLSRLPICLLPALCTRVCFHHQKPRSKTPLSYTYFYTCLRDAVCCEPSRSSLHQALSLSLLAARKSCSSPHLLSQSPSLPRPLLPTPQHPCARESALNLSKIEIKKIKPLFKNECPQSMSSQLRAGPTEPQLRVGRSHTSGSVLARNCAPPFSLDQGTAWPSSSWSQITPRGHFHTNAVRSDQLLDV